MAPNTSARNASPAPRASNKNDGSKENDSQNLIQTEHEQPSKKLQATLKKNVSQRPTQNEIAAEPQKQGKLATLKSKAVSTARATGCSLASTCCSGRVLVRGMFQQSKTCFVETVSGISQRSKASLVAFLMILIAGMVFLSLYSTDSVGDFAVGVQKVASQAWSATSQSLAGLVSRHSAAPADL